MMKLAWLCYSKQYVDSTGGYAEEIETIMFTEPSKFYGYSKVIPIVYAELKE